MKGFLKWLGKVVGTALTLVLIIVLLPHASRLIGRFLPDGSSKAVTISSILSRSMEATSRLECAKVEDEGVIASSVDALLIGTVQNVVIYYTYEASIGIDLKKLKMHIDGNQLVLELPELEVLTDSLTPTKVERNDFWFPLTEERRLNILEAERLNCRSHYLEENAESEMAFEHAVTAMREFVDQILSETTRQGVDIVCVRAAADP